MRATPRKHCQILEQKKVDPHSFAGTLDYSSLYEKEGNYDEAVNVVLYFLTNVAGVQSLSESSPIYQRLVELKDYHCPTVSAPL